ncbi:hypothetical protein L9W92_01525 [Pelotomaculum terephthalicicum JT]|uniref:hypothetical protein n=1 Tax=Pelotomaculum TaxID=191373 RepID=UPI0009CAC74C|nr:MULTISPECIES: hypothetical protein [Pelotomaculum]MCG9966737.1 hypothetical protein [Pelotomaculum terephthalicicum JT]OPX85574.1 MAG: hypothetical protein A4E54_02383 [Pelotomaculum sp. PtaB.Bin117]
MKERKVSKKSIILSFLEKQDQIPVSEIAILLYGNYSMLEHVKVVNLLSAYRANDPRFKNIRVRNKHICYV